MKKEQNEALIIVDYQNDFAHPEGSLYVPEGELILPYINSIITEMKNNSSLIISSQDWHPENHTSFASNHGVEPFSMKDDEMKWPNHCVENTWGSQFLDGLKTDQINTKILKGFEANKECYSAFGGKDFETEKMLNEILETHKIELLHIVGLATDYCDLATVTDALKNGYAINLHTKGIKAVNANPGDGESNRSYEKYGSKYYLKMSVYFTL